VTEDRLCDVPYLPTANDSSASELARTTDLHLLSEASRQRQSSRNSKPQDSSRNLHKTWALPQRAL